MAALYLKFIKPRLKTKYSFVSRNFLCTSKLASTSLAVVCKVREFVCLRTVQFHKIYFKSQSQYLVTHNTFQNNIKIHHTCISTYKKAWLFWGVFFGGGAKPLLSQFRLGCSTNLMSWHFYFVINLILISLSQWFLTEISKQKPQTTGHDFYLGIRKVVAIWINFVV